jgi:hypothetical protein
LSELAGSLGCYKVTLNCTDKTLPYYSKFGFLAETNNANFLVMRVAEPVKKSV